MHRLLVPVRLFALAILVFAPSIPVAKGEDAVAIDDRLATAVKYLSSDELEGRGIGTEGINRAADYVAEQFAKLGLKTDVFDGGPFQKFTMTTGTSRGPNNTLTLVASDGKRTELKLDEGFTPLALGGAAKFDLPLVFVGYGITAKDEQYDDYAGIDVKGKAVVILRHEPQQANPHSKFEGEKNSAYAPFARKVSNAYEHGAAAVLLVSDDFDIKKNVADFERRWQTAIDQLAEAQAKFKQIEKPSVEQRVKHREAIGKHVDEIKSWEKQIVDAGDPLLSFTSAGEADERREMPVLYVRRSVAETLIQSVFGKSLATIEAEIDKKFEPQSRELAGWKIEGNTDVTWTQAEVKNVVGILEGEGPHADEAIVIGAHYDHLGRGGSNSAQPGSKEIHNGADDNASGVATLIEVAREIVARGKPARRIVFIAFTGEERGLIGSARYVRNPLVPLDKTIVMLNMDMVGRLTDNKLIIYGTGTAPQLETLVDRLGTQFGFNVTKTPSGFGPSDHSSFYAKQIPVLHFFTGTHSDYHRPSDDFEKLNIAGMRRVGELVADTAVALADASDRPTYQETKGTALAGGGGDRPYFGSIPDFAQEQPGYALTGVSKGGPAEKAGIKAGDIIVQLGESKIGNLEDFDSALRKFRAGDKVPVTVKRGTEQVRVEVVLDPPK
jgi:hypothetical protein